MLRTGGAVFVQCFASTPSTTCAIHVLVRTSKTPLTTTSCCAGMGKLQAEHDACRQFEWTKTWHKTWPSGINSKHSALSACPLYTVQESTTQERVPKNLISMAVMTAVGPLRRHRRGGCPLTSAVPHARVASSLERPRCLPKSTRWYQLAEVFWIQS